MTHRSFAPAAIMSALALGAGLALSGCAPGGVPAATPRPGPVADVSEILPLGEAVQEQVDLDTLRKAYTGPEGAFFTAVAAEPESSSECLFVVAPDGGGGMGCGGMTLILLAHSADDTPMIYAFLPGPGEQPPGSREVADGIWVGEYVDPARAAN